MRLAILLCFALVGCASPQDGEIETRPLSVNDPPNITTPRVIASLKAVAAGAQLEDPLEVSDPIESTAISSAHWMICLRGGISDQSKFHLLIEQCEVLNNLTFFPNPSF